MIALQLQSLQNVDTLRAHALCRQDAERGTRAVNLWIGSHGIRVFKASQDEAFLDAYLYQQMLGGWSFSEEPAACECPAPSRQTGCADRGPLGAK